MKYHKLNIVLLSIACLHLSCKKFLDIDAPKDSLVQENIFQNDDIATSAITGMYYNMAATGYASGNSGSISSVCGLSADEFSTHNTGFAEFYENQITPVNSYVTNSLYLVPYQQIYTVNSVLEGLAISSTVSPSVKAQLQGEALFIRAFTYFYLVNLYGAVPLQLTSDYRITKVSSRTSTDQVYQQIISDLKAAEGLLTDNYVTTERIRPNLSAVQALLARTYLYLKDWENAEKYASLVIDKTNIYHLVNLNDIFLKNSSEAIWQLMPRANSNTNEGFLFILLSTPTSVFLSDNFILNAFEENDNRKAAWVKSFSNSTGTYYYPYKYKVRSSTTVTEYSMVMRLAEQYLIRAEARAQQENIPGAIDDVDAIRNRAGITLIKNTNPGIGKLDLLTVIQKERRAELFSEWGHRWFDLIRTGQAGSVLGPLKPQWQPTDEYYPIPQNEINRNHNVIQNNGY